MSSLILENDMTNKLQFSENDRNNIEQMGRLQKKLAKIKFNISDIFPDHLALKNINNLVNSSSLSLITQNKKVHYDTFLRAEKEYQKLLSSISKIDTSNFRQLAGLRDNTSKKTFALFQMILMEKWPLFTMLNKDYVDYIFQDIAKQFSKEVFVERTLSYFSKRTEEIFLRRWKNTFLSNSKRLEILNKGLQLYDQEAYEGCTSLMVCQFDGVILEIKDILKNNGVTNIPERTDELFLSIFPHIDESNHAKKWKSFDKLSERDLIVAIMSETHFPTIKKEGALEYIS